MNLHETYRLPRHLECAEVTLTPLFAINLRRDLFLIESMRQLIKIHNGNCKELEENMSRSTDKKFQN